MRGGEIFSEGQHQDEIWDGLAPGLECADVGYDVAGSGKRY